MFGFLRPFLIVLIIAGVFVGTVSWNQMKNWNDSLVATDADGIESGEGDGQEFMDKLFWPTRFLPEDVKSKLGWFDFAAYCLMVGFSGWLFLESSWAIIKPRDRDERRTIIPSFSFGRLICFGLFLFLLFSWVSHRLV